MAQQERPVHEVRLGKVKAAIWRNATESGVRFGVTIARIYKTESGWETSQSFGRDELPLVCKVADMAHLWIFQQNDRSEAGETKDAEQKPQRAPAKRRERASSR